MRQAALLDAGFLKIGGRGGLGARTDLDVVDDLRGTGGSRHASRGTFMLNHAGAAFPSDYPMLHVEVKTVFADFGFGQLCLDLRVGVGRGGMNGASSRSAARFRT